jgi:hypothetical protein
MIKYLSILLLILISTTAANAVYLKIDGQQTDSIGIPQATTSVITVVSEDSSNWLGYLVIEDGGTGTLSKVNIFPSAGNLASATAFTDPGFGNGYELIAGMLPVGEPVVSPGTQFSMDYSGGIIGKTAKISLFIDPHYATPVSSITVSIVPEPLSIALLGFGCLFLYQSKSRRSRYL